MSENLESSLSEPQNEPEGFSHSHSHPMKKKKEKSKKSDKKKRRKRKKRRDMSENEMAEKIKTIQYYRSKITDEEKKQFKQSRVYVMLMSRSIETLSNALGMESIQTRGLTKNVENSMNSGDFNAAIEACVSNKDTASIISNPVASFGATFCDILMQTHMNNIHKNTHNLKKKNFVVPEHQESVQKVYIPKNQENASQSLVQQCAANKSPMQNPFFQKKTVSLAEKVSENNADTSNVLENDFYEKMNSMQEVKIELERLRDDISDKSAQLLEQKNEMEAMFKKMQAQNSLAKEKSQPEASKDSQVNVAEFENKEHSVTSVETSKTVPVRQFTNAAQGSEFEKKLVDIVNNVAPIVELIANSNGEDTVEEVGSSLHKPESFENFMDNIEV